MERQIYITEEQFTYQTPLTQIVSDMEVIINNTENINTNGVLENVVSYCENLEEDKHYFLKGEINEDNTEMCVIIDNEDGYEMLGVMYGDFSNIL